MNSILKPYLRRFVLVFFDDILIYSSTSELHSSNLRTILETFKNDQLFTKQYKCFFVKKKWSI